MYSVGAAVLRPTLDVVRHNAVRSVYGVLAKKAAKKGPGFMTEDALAIREARKKKKEDAANKKYDPEFLMTGKEKRELKELEQLKQLKLDKEQRPKFTYPAEIMTGYIPLGPDTDHQARRKQQRKITKLKKQDKAMERAHRRHYLEVPLPTLHANYIQEPDGMRDLALTAIHYNVASDVLRQKGLLLTTPLNIRYKDGDFVHRGNIVSPATAQTRPSMFFKPGSDDTLYTMIMTTPDGNIFAYREEVLHWMACNIPGNKIDQGDEICPYLPPIPCEGTGYHRYAFVLLKQVARIEGVEPLPSRDLEKRSFITSDFIKKHELGLRGLAFYQAKWDASVGDVFDELGCGEPTYNLVKPHEVHLDPKQSQAIFKKRAYLRHKM
eukprot:scpid82552/ scgid23127/ 39S ribosomal protein L38, mitochondrial